ncbi:hypothetical protein [Mucilaginibacter agri]|uniref:Uncharacterized protein n=1 Tax=Mucilaginibacter agri TaxID=2695265 RepID=A0A966DU68_9SPHI|nr:hypothetical protein [Mucilaginibacter agri]NCD71410.1 hypothetical protein [Mucilaginibacter agri]
MITKEKVRIFDHYSGDRDAFILLSKDEDKTLFENDDWALIHTFYENIFSINGRLTSEEFTKSLLKDLKARCNEEAFYLLTSKINSYSDFQKIADILKQIKAITHADADTIWAGFDNATLFLKDLDRDITGIQFCSFIRLEKINLEFLVTSTYQELSMSNGWGDHYLRLAETFDQLYNRLTKKKLDNRPSSQVQP